VTLRNSWKIQALLWTCSQKDGQIAPPLAWHSNVLIGYWLAKQMTNCAFFPLHHWVLLKAQSFRSWFILPSSGERKIKVVPTAPPPPPVRASRKTWTRYETCRIKWPSEIGFWIVLFWVLRPCRFASTYQRSRVTHCNRLLRITKMSEHRGQHRNLRRCTNLKSHRSGDKVKEKQKKSSTRCVTPVSETAKLRNDKMVICSSDAGRYLQVCPVT
jgi:hypothetical protein